jgi:hypothetical protein
MKKEPGEPKKSMLDQSEDLEAMTIGKQAAESSLHLLMATLGDAESVEGILDLNQTSNIPGTDGISKKKAIEIMLKALKNNLEYLEEDEKEFAGSTIRTAEIYIAGS